MWKEVADQSAPPPDWLAVGVFWTLAFAWSFAAARLSTVDEVAGLPIDSSLLVGFGPAIAAYVAPLLRRSSNRRATLLGQTGWLAVAAMAVPIAIAVVAGYAGHASPRTAALVLSLSILIYCWGEERGWRGWLYEELASLRLWQSALVTGVLWYAWHWSFLDEAKNIQFGLGIVAASFGFAFVARRTRSVGFATAWHTAMKLLWSPTQAGAMVAALVALTWAAGRKTPTIRPGGSP